MEVLQRIIGPSPSERSLEELEEVVLREHQRVSRSIFSPQGGRKKAAKKAPSLTKKVKSFEEKYGSLEALEEKLEKLREFEEKEKKSGSS